MLNVDGYDLADWSLSRQQSISAEKGWSGTYAKAVKGKEISSEARSVKALISFASLLNGSRSDIYHQSLFPAYWFLGYSPRPTIRRILACFHFCKSPPFPHPRSSTLAPGALWGLYANLPIRTDLIQLLNFLKPIIGDNSRASRPTSWRELSIYQQVGGVEERTMIRY